MDLRHWLCGDAIARLYPYGVNPLSPFERDFINGLDGLLGGDDLRYATGGSGRNGAAGLAFPFRDADRATVSHVLDEAGQWLGPGYKEAEPGRFVSADGMRQFRMKDGDIQGLHGGGSHVNFDILASDPA